ncbi:hypothetical protein SVIOM342S_04744 [Streptomyces violaceorubidus]
MTDSSDVTACDWEREPDPSDSLRTFGAVVQALREHAGLSRAEFAALVRFSKHTVESVELGRRMPDESFVERAEEVLGNTAALRKAARHLTRGEARLAAWFRRCARLEKVSVNLSHVRVSPGSAGCCQRTQLMRDGLLLLLFVAVRGGQRRLISAVCLVPGHRGDEPAPLFSLLEGRASLEQGTLGAMASRRRRCSARSAARSGVVGPAEEADF